ncbi:hypothetical protein [Candidatus Ruthturnera calyptogenae]
MACVFIRRLQRNMCLQTDSSMVYVLSEYYQVSLKKRDLNFNSP